MKNRHCSCKKTVTIAVKKTVTAAEKKKRHCRYKKTSLFYGENYIHIRGFPQSLQNKSGGAGRFRPALRGHRSPAHSARSAKRRGYKVDIHVDIGYIMDNLGLSREQTMAKYDTATCDMTRYGDVRYDKIR